MDREQEEMQFIGLFGIYKESIKIIISWRRIFSQITLALILPLAFIFLAHMEVFHLFFSSIRHAEIQRDFSRLNRMGVFVWAISLGDSESDAVGVTSFIIVAILYAVGFVHMTIIWQLASVVSVLETSYGINAMTKAKKLIKGQRILAVAIFIMLNMSLVGIEMMFELLVVHGSSLGMWKRVGFGVLCFLLLFLFRLVIQTLLYLVCKSYHHENIDKLSLSSHLESYLGEYEPLNKNPNFGRKPNWG